MLQSVSALNIVKRDLAEFTSVMHEDTAKVAASMKEKLTVFSLYIYVFYSLS
jgi:hypothetical protein